MVKISAVISAYNEEEKIEECLKSLDFADEIVFVDNQSSDKTIQIAKKYTKHIFSRPNDIMLNVNKNFGFSKAKGEWVLNIDADERVTRELAQEIELGIRNQESGVNGYWIPRKNIIFGKWIQSDMWWPDFQLRLFRKGKGRFPEKHVHEYIEVEKETQKLQNPMIHENYSSISQYLYKMDTIYTENEVKNFIESEKMISWTDSIRFPVEDFLKTFFLQKGYRDGLHGLVLSFLQAFYAEVVFAKLWERQGFMQKESENFLQEVFGEFKHVVHEFRYWFLTSYIENSKNPVQKFLYRLLRKGTQNKLNKK